MKTLFETSFDTIASSLRHPQNLITLLSILPHNSCCIPLYRFILETPSLLDLFHVTTRLLCDTTTHPQIYLYLQLNSGKANLRAS